MVQIRMNFRLFLAAILLVVFALPSSAANGPDGSDKTYSLDVDPHPTVAGLVLAIFTNQGNSSFNSLTINAPSGLEFTGTPSSSRGTAVKVSASQVKVTGINLPTGAGQHVDLTLPVKVTTCAGEAADWTAQPYAGSSLTGQRFDPSTTVASDLRTGISGVCMYSYSVATGPVNVGSTKTMTATFTNDPSSTASFNSVTLTAPSNWKFKTGTLPMGWTASPTNFASQVTISSTTNFILASYSLVVPIDVSVPCSVTSSGTWSSSMAGAIGAFAPPATNPSTGVNGPCSLTVESPADATAGTAFSVTVKAKDGGNNVVEDLKCEDVTFSKYSGVGSLTSGTCTDTGGVVTKQLTINGTGPFVLTASSTYGGASLNKNTSSFTVYGEIDCNQAIPAGYLNPDGLLELYPTGNANEGLPVSGWAGDGKRARFNKDGSACSLVDYTFTNSILTENKVILEWITTAQPNAAFRYSMTWKPEWANPGTGLPNVSATLVSWKLTGGYSTPVAGRACLSSQLPAPYGTLTAVTTSPDSITIGGPYPLGFIPLPPVAVPFVPFPIFIGSERLLVTGLESGTTYSVLRAQGGTSSGSPAVSTALVMSNPLPLDASSNQMQVCLADQAFATVTANLCVATPPTNPPPACMVLTTTVFDIGDGTTSRTAQ